MPINNVRIMPLLLEKMAFTPAAGLTGPTVQPAAPAPMTPGAPMGDPSMMGGAPMDPSMGGGAPMDPSMAGGAPAGAPMGDPSMMGGAPAGGPMLVDPSTGMAMPQDPASMPITMLTVGDLIGLIGDVVSEVLSTQAGAPAAGAPAPGAEGAANGEEGGEKPKDSTAAKPDMNDVVSRLDQLISLVGGAPTGTPPAAPQGPTAGAVDAGGMGPKAASARGATIADAICSKVRGFGG